MYQQHAPYENAQSDAHNMISISICGRPQDLHTGMHRKTLYLSPFSSRPADVMIPVPSAFDTE